MINLTKAAFEQYVPSFRDSEPHTYEAILPYLTEHCRQVYVAFGVPEDFTETSKVESYVYRAAAYRALPHLDLVLTDNGFAVVSNQNLAPASRDRVAALSERLREEMSNARDELLFALCGIDAWRNMDIARRLRSTLLWCPMLCRRYGVTDAERRPVYEREYIQLKPQIEAAQERVERMVSREQMAWMLEHQDEYDLTDAVGDARIVLREQCRKLMAAIVVGRSDSERELIVRLQDYLNRHAEELPEYNESSKYKADHFDNYQNEKNDPCFFFA